MALAQGENYIKRILEQPLLHDCKRLTLVLNQIWSLRTPNTVKEHSDFDRINHYVKYKANQTKCAKKSVSWLGMSEFFTSMYNNFLTLIIVAKHLLFLSKFASKRTVGLPKKNVIPVKLS